MSELSEQAQHESTAMDPIFVTETDLEPAINYPGEARYLALILGLSGELWYDDGTYTGLTRLTVQCLLPHFQGSPNASAFLFDRHTQDLFIGPPEAISAYLQLNIQPQLELRAEQTL